MGHNDPDQLDADDSVIRWMQRQNLLSFLDRAAARQAAGNSRSDLHPCEDDLELKRIASLSGTGEEVK